jgi:hypothetical protein
VIDFERLPYDTPGHVRRGQGCIVAYHGAMSIAAVKAPPRAIEDLAFLVKQFTAPF